MLGLSKNKRLWIVNGIATALVVTAVILIVIFAVVKPNKSLTPPITTTIATYTTSLSSVIGTSIPSSISTTSALGTSTSSAISSSTVISTANTTAISNATLTITTGSTSIGAAPPTSTTTRTLETSTATFTASFASFTASTSTPPSITTLTVSTTIVAVITTAGLQTGDEIAIAFGLSTVFLTLLGLIIGHNERARKLVCGCFRGNKEPATDEPQGSAESAIDATITHLPPNPTVQTNTNVTTPVNGQNIFPLLGSAARGSEGNEEAAPAINETAWSALSASPEMEGSDRLPAAELESPNGLE